MGGRLVIVVGLGKAGCNIAKAFSKFPQYKTYGIDSDKTADITIKKRPTHEEYDKHCRETA
jgi:UDP-N-acetylmuramoylalanine-D-glutamate ligase